MVKAHPSPVALPGRRRWLARLPAWAAACSGGGVLGNSHAAGLPELVARSKPAVVAVGTWDPLGNPRFGFRGSGFAIGDGLTVVTGAHVLAPVGSGGANAPDLPNAIQVPGRRQAGAHASGGETGDTRVASVLALDRERDLALLRIEGKPLPTLPLAAESSGREGQAVALIGFPLGGLVGYTHVTHRGIIASVTPIVLPPASASRLDAGAVARMRQGVFDIFQLDATAYPGNSGGPLLDADSGEVLGVLNMVLVKTTRESALTHPSGISYAVPVRWVHALAARR